MGIIDFVRDAGAAIGIGESAKKTPEAGGGEALDDRAKADKLLKLIRDMDQGVRDPAVEFRDGVATVRGTAPNQMVKENTVLVIGNVRGVARVDDRMEVEEPAPEATFYTVESGDTLSGIAKAHYGDGAKYMKIFEANRPMLKDPDEIYPGQKLRIPPE